MLFVKLLALSLGLAAGLPLGRDGPHVHMACCILRQLQRDTFDASARHRPHGAGAEGQGPLVQKLLLAATATGLAQTTAAPVGGVLMALELMLPQTYDYTAYWGCFTASILGAVLFAVENTQLGVLPFFDHRFISTNFELFSVQKTLKEYHFHFTFLLFSGSGASP